MGTSDLHAPERHLAFEWQTIAGHAFFMSFHCKARLMRNCHCCRGVAPQRASERDGKSHDKPSESPRAMPGPDLDVAAHSQIWGSNQHYIPILLFSFSPLHCDQYVEVRSGQDIVRSQTFSDRTIYNLLSILQYSKAWLHIFMKITMTILDELQYSLISRAVVLCFSHPRFQRAYMWMDRPDPLHVPLQHIVTKQGPPSRKILLPCRRPVAGFPLRGDR